MDRDMYIAEMKMRTKQFALGIVRLFKSPPKNDVARIMGKQLLRSGTSLAANYRAACRSRSNAEFTAKIGIVVEEADESVFWMELLVESSTIPERKLASLLAEGNELVATFASAYWKAKRPVRN